MTDEQLDTMSRSMTAADLAALISRVLDGDTEDRGELAEALARTGIEESARLEDLANRVRCAERQLRGLRRYRITATKPAGYFEIEALDEQAAYDRAQHMLEARGVSVVEWWDDAMGPGGGLDRCGRCAGADRRFR